MKTTRTQVTIPAYAQWPADTLFVESACDGLVTSGMCSTAEEARQRCDAYLAGRMPPTEAPDGQANTREMMRARAQLERSAIRDGGYCQRAIEAALKAGLHTVEWAIASRYLVAGWV